MIEETSMIRRIFASRPGQKRSSKAPASARRQRMTVEGLEGRQLLTMDFTAAMGLGGSYLTTRSAAADAQGDTYVTGAFGGTVDFNPAGSASPLTAAGTQDAFLAKYAPGGALLWAKDLAGTPGGRGLGNAVAVDAAGNVVVGGQFAGAVGFAHGVTVIAPGGAVDAFVAKYDANGGYLWSDRYDNGTTQAINGLAADAAGNVYAAGNFIGGGNFNQAGGALAGGSGTNGFALKLTPGGSTAWAVAVGGTGSQQGKKVVVDGLGNVDVAGTFTDAATVGGFILTTAGGLNAYVTQLSGSTGAARWADAVGGPTGMHLLGGLAADAAGNVYIGGTFYGTASVAGAYLTASAPRGPEAFVARLDAGGGVQWATHLDADQGASVNDLKLDGAGGVYAGGNFEGTTSFDPSGRGRLISGQGSDGFVAKLTASAGSYQYAVKGGGSGVTTVTAITVIAPDVVQATGSYASPGTFGATTLGGAGLYNSYVGTVSMVASVTNGDAVARAALEAESRAEAQRFADMEANGSMQPMGDPHAQADMAHVNSLVDIPHVTNMAITDGLWSDPNTWAGGRVPGADANVWIMPGRTVTVDGLEPATLRTVRVSGTLTFATDVDTKLVVDTMVVDPDGSLIMGTPTSPIAAGVTATVVFADRGAIDRGWDPYGLSRGLVDRGHTVICGAQAGGHNQLAVTPRAGDTTLTFAGATPGWKAGDDLVLPGTYGVPDQHFTITSVSADGKVLGLGQPVKYSLAAPTQLGEVLYAADLTRNVVFRSQNTTDIDRRGHVMFMHTNDADIRYAAFEGLGRTLFNEPFNNAKVGADGKLVPGTGTNPQGRYALHFHMAGADIRQTPALVQGCVVDGSPGWGYDNHGSNVDFEGNVAYNSDQAGFVTEDGNEVGTFNDNIAIRGQAFGFWLHGPAVKVTNNIAVGFDSTYGDGFEVYAGGNITGGPAIYFAAANLAGPPVVDPRAPAGEIDIQSVPFHLVGNQAYNCWGGIEIREHRGMVLPTERSTIEGGTVWGSLRGVTVNYSDGFDIKGTNLYGMPTFAGAAIFGDATPGDMAYTDLNVVGWAEGIEAPNRGHNLITGGYLDNIIDIYIPSGGGGNDIENTSMRTVDITGVKFGTTDYTGPYRGIPTFSQSYHIYINDSNYGGHWLGKRYFGDQVLLDGKQVYYQDQAESYVQTDTGVPELDGKTNAANWAAYGLAPGGAVAPADAAADPSIFGGLIGSTVDVPVQNMVLYSDPQTSQRSGYVPALRGGPTGYLAGSPVDLHAGWNLVPFVIDGKTRSALVEGV